MKIVFLFCALAVFVSLIELQEGKLISKRHHPFSVVSRLSKHVKRYAHEVIRGHRTKRSSCVDDLTLASSPRFEHCQAIAEEFSDDEPVSEHDINNYCYNDCGNFVVDLYISINTDCGFSPGGNVDQRVLDLLRGSCSLDPHGDYCLLDWEYDKSYFWETSYINCLNSSNDQKSCAPNCRIATKGIKRDYGCCSSYLVDFYPDDYLSDSVFTTCKVNPPKHC